MGYPIFNSISNFVKSELEHRNVTVSKFRQWEEALIKASGFEVIVDLNTREGRTKNIVINWDWDQYKEYTLAKQLKGMSEHPLLQNKQLSRFGLEPTVDIEVAWVIDEELIQKMSTNAEGSQRVDVASKWMKEVNKVLSYSSSRDTMINRWHVEIDGDEYGKYLSTISLISYFQFNFVDLQELEQIHRYLDKKLQQLLLISSRVMRVLDTVNAEAA